jgi:hypothetical protein
MSTPNEIDAWRTSGLNLLKCRIQALQRHTGVG